MEPEVFCETGLRRAERVHAVVRVEHMLKEGPLS